MKCRADKLASELCAEIDMLQYQLELMTEERDEFRQKYNTLLDKSLRESQRTTGQILSLALNKWSHELNGRGLDESGV